MYVDHAYLAVDGKIFYCIKEYDFYVGWRDNCEYIIKTKF